MEIARYLGGAKIRITLRHKSTLQKAVQVWIAGLLITTICGNITGLVEGVETSDYSVE